MHGAHVAQLAIRGHMAIERSIQGWRSGLPTEEIALLNRITEQLSGMSLCHAGDGSRLLVSTDVRVLHRRGASGRDKYGSDLAVSIRLPESGLEKLAFFQLKKQESSKIIVEAAQMAAAATWLPILLRSWIAAACPARGEMRLEAVESVRALLSRGQKTLTVYPAHWRRSDSWLFNWLSCSIGPDNSAHSGALLEQLLLRFTQKGAEGGTAARSDLDPVISSLPRYFVPARAWATITIERVAP